MPDSRILRFDAPPGWPTPDVDWQSVHAGWRPEAGWTPVPGAPPAPGDWRFWSPLEPAWSAAVRKQRAPCTRWIVIGGLLCLAGLLLTGIGYASARPGGSYVVWSGLILFGAVASLRNIVRSVRAPGTVLAHLEATAPQRIEAHHRARYAAYLIQQESE